MAIFNFKQIDVPAAAGTYAYISVDGVDAAGEAVGNYGNVDGEGDQTFYGLTAAANGNGVTYNPPNSSNTDVIGITSGGEIFGNYTDNENSQRAFVDNGGTVSLINVLFSNNTSISGVNDSGLIYGEFADFNDKIHGFIDNGGTYVQIDAPNAANTAISGINAGGLIVGTYGDNSTGAEHGFADFNGSFQTIDPAGSVSTSVVGVSNAGVVVGNYEDSNNVQHSFVDNGGVITTINIPGASNTGISAINAAGEIVGYYADGDGNIHGFIDLGGAVVSVEVPGATATDILGVSATGVISGYFNDSSFNQHGFVGTPTLTMIGSNGSTTLSEFGGEYYAVSNGGIDQLLQYGGSPVTVGEFGGVTPIDAVKTATGYDIAWHIAGTDQFTFWSTDANGNYTSNLSGLVEGNSFAVESMESVFGQDFNGDGTIGVTASLVQADGNTDLLQIADNYYAYVNGAGPELKYGGAPVTVGEFGGIAPIGAIQTATGYDIAWKIPGTDQLTFWAVDNNGNYVSNLTNLVPGNSFAVESLESTFGQDLNGDGTIGVTASLVQTDASTSLLAIANDYYIYTNGSGPELMDGGSPVTAGEFGNIAPVGAIQTAGGYDVAWQIPGTSQFTFWSVDSNGNYLSNITGLIAGTDPTLKSMEATFYQDFNGDGYINSPTTVIDVTGHVTLGLSTVAQPSAIEAGATLEMTGTGTSSVTFEGSTGTLVLDHSQTFTGQIFNFNGNGNPTASDQFDLRDIAFGSGTTESYNGNASSGILTVEDSQGHMAHIHLSGNYTASTFSLSSDGQGGTTVIDPPTAHLASNSFVFKDSALPAAAPTNESVWLAEAGHADHSFKFSADASTPPSANDGHDAYAGQGNDPLAHLHQANLADHHFIIS